MGENRGDGLLIGEVLVGFQEEIGEDGGDGLLVWVVLVGFQEEVGEDGSDGLLVEVVSAKDHHLGFHLQKWV